MPAKSRVHVCAEAALPAGEKVIIDAAGKSIGVFNTGSRIVAALNLCPHEFAPVCLGKLSGATLPSQPGEFIWGRENEILRCPWHGWEFDLHTGQCLTDRSRLRLFPVIISEGQIFVNV